MQTRSGANVGMLISLLSSNERSFYKCKTQLNVKSRQVRKKQSWRRPQSRSGKSAKTLLDGEHMRMWYVKAININIDNDFSLRNRGPRRVFHNSYTIQLSTDVNFTECCFATSVCWWEISLYRGVLKAASSQRRLAHFIAAC